MRRSTNAGLAIVGAVCCSQIAFSQQPSRPIPPRLLTQLAGQGQASYLIVLRDKADLEAAATISDRAARGRFVYR